MKSGIYKIENIINGKVYIGSSRGIIGRLKGHLLMLNKNIHINKHLQNSYNKHGRKYFKFSAVEYCSIEKLIEREQYWLDFYRKNGKVYNIRKKCVASNKGIKHSEETKKIMSEQRKGHIVTEETRKKISLGNKGKPNKFRGTKLSEEHKQKIREAKKFISDETKKKLSIALSGKNNPNYGKKHSEEWKQMMSKKFKGRIISEEQKQQVSAKLMGHPVSEEARRKMSLANKGKKQTAEWIKNALEGRMKRFKKDLQ